MGRPASVGFPMTFLYTNRPCGGFVGLRLSVFGMSGQDETESITEKQRIIRSASGSYVETACLLSITIGALYRTSLHQHICLLREPALLGAQFLYSAPIFISIRAILHLHCFAWVIGYRLSAIGFRFLCSSGV